MPDQFVKAYPEDVPDDAARQFIKIARKELDALGLEEDVKVFWEPRLAKIAGWLVTAEQAWRQTMVPLSLKSAARLCSVRRMAILS